MGFARHYKMLCARLTLPRWISGYGPP